MNSLSKIAVATVLASAGLNAGAASITNLDGTFDDFGGFDWASNGSVWIQGYDVLAGANNIGDTDLFTLTYMAYATTVDDTDGNAFTMPGLNTNYEYTIFATVQESVTCITAGCTVVQIDVLSGVWDIYYDTNVNASMSAGTGVTDGTLILSGDFAASPTSQSLIAPQGTENPGDVALLAALVGSVNYTNLLYIDPALDGTTAVSTLQFGDLTTNWTRPTSFDGAPTGADTNTSFVGQADANQSFSSVPEPGTLALFGLAFGLAGFMARKQARS